MADFNIKLRDNNPDSTRASRGVRAGEAQADTSLGELFAGGAQFIENATDAINLGINMEIKKDLTREVDQTRDDFIAASGVIQEEPGAQGDLRKVPENLRADFNRSTNLARAFKQGKIRESNYWARMDDIARTMRSRFPGHRDEIDRHVSSLTGRVPANALRSALAQELKAAQSASSTGDKQRNSLLTAAAKAGYNDVVKLFTQRPDLGLDKLQVAVANRASIDAKLDLRSKELTVMDKEGDLRTDQIKSAARGEVYASLAPILSSVGAETDGGITVPQLKAKITELAEAKRPPTAEEEQQIRAMFTKLSVQMTAVADQTLNKNRGGLVWGSRLSESERSDIKAIPENILKPLQDAIFNKDSGISTWASDILDAMGNEEQLRIFEEEPGLLNVSAMKEILTGPLFNFLLAQDGSQESLSNTINIIRRATTLKAASGQSESAHRDIQGMRTKGVGPRGIKRYINKTADAFSFPKAPEEVVGNLSKTLYATGSENIMSSLSDDSQLQIYNKLLSNESIAAADKATDPEVKQRQLNWASLTFQSVIGRKLVNEIKSVAQDGDIKYNEKTNRFSLSKRLGGTDTSPFNSAATFNVPGGNKIRVLRPAIEKLNQAVTILERRFSDPNDVRAALSFAGAPGVTLEDAENTKDDG